MRRKRLSRQTALNGLAEPTAPTPAPGPELRQTLDEELHRLPDHYRTAIVLCDLEGKTQKDAARELACPPGTIACRLTRGRSLLARRLARHGLLLSSGALALFLASNGASAGVRTPLVAATVKAASAVAAGASASAVVSPGVAELAQRVLTSFLIARLKVALAVLVAATVVGLVALPALLADQAAASQDPTAEAAETQEATPLAGVVDETQAADRAKTAAGATGKQRAPVERQVGGLIGSAPPATKGREDETEASDPGSGTERQVVTPGTGPGAEKIAVPPRSSKSAETRPDGGRRGNLAVPSEWRGRGASPADKPARPRDDLSHAQRPAGFREGVK